MSDIASVANTRPPAKLNLFLELLQKRDDGFHEIDSVMVAIDLCDELRIQRTSNSSILIDVDWLPSRQTIARRLGVESDPEKTTHLLQIPDNDTNLVHRALTQFAARFQIDGGFACRLRKRIPAGAGLGGASSDAASALLCAARLCSVPENAPELAEIAASIGSDVPFFLGCNDSGTRIAAARVRGRGERLEPLLMASPLHVVVAYPGASLSTPTVYAQSQIPNQPASPNALIGALATGNVTDVQSQLLNRLADPAKKILPRIDEILKSMWRSGLQACQLTGSGSACFAVANTALISQQGAQQLQSMLEPGVLVIATRSTSVPAAVVMSSSSSSDDE